MGILKERITPRRIALQDGMVRTAAAPSPPPAVTMPPLFKRAPAEAPPQDWPIRMPWRKLPPPAYTPTRLACAYIDKAGALYIGTPPLFNTFTVYTSVEAYNTRAEIPCIIPAEAAPVAELTSVELLHHALRVNNIG